MASGSSFASPKVVTGGFVPGSGPIGVVRPAGAAAAVAPTSAPPSVSAIAHAVSTLCGLALLMLAHSVPVTALAVCVILANVAALVLPAPTKASESPASPEDQEAPRPVGRYYPTTLAAFDELFRLYLPRVRAYIADNQSPDAKVVEYRSPQELQQILDLELPQVGGAAAGLAKVVEDTLRYSTRTGHRMFLDKLYAGNDSVGAFSELLTSVLNTNIHTYAVAPVFVVMELELLKRLRKLFDFPDDGDGIFCPGGTYSNMLALMAAREAALPGSMQTGVGSARLIAFTSDQAHYSVSGAVGVAGLGKESLVRVKCDEFGAMLPSDLALKLRACVSSGGTPFIVSTTAGTTVTGAFDPFDAIADVIRDFQAEYPAMKVWFHVDGSFGGAMCASPTLRSMLRGVERADSVAFNAHKMWGLPLQCAALLVRRSGVLHSTFSTHANYLYHDHPNAQFDVGDKTLQCGRHVDCLKFFMSWKYHGLDGYARRVEYAHSLAQELERLVRADRRFRLVKPAISFNVCFWYLPQGLRNVTDLKPHYKLLDSLTPALYSRMQRNGRVLVNFNPLTDQGLPRFFRAVLQSPELVMDDMRLVLDQIAMLGDEMDVGVAM